MNEALLAFLAGAAWLAVFTAGLFAFANWVQRRDRQRHDSGTSAGYDRRETTASDRPERRGGA